MNKKLLLNLILIFTIGLVNAQNALWTKTAESRLDALQKFERASTPKHADFYTLNYEAMKTILQTAPTRDFSGAISTTIVSFPNANGTLEQFSIYESSVMAPELAAKYPEIQSYVGQGITNRSARIYLTTTIFGLHGMVLSDKGTYYIDPFTTNLQNYIVYNKSSLTTSRSFTCYNEVTPENEIQFVPSSTMIADGLFRIYRLAMACTTEYAAFHVNAAIGAGTITSGATVAQKKAVVLAAMNVTVSRVNSVYETDMSLKMQLVANNDAIIFITSDSFNNTNPNVLIGQSQTVIDGAIGFSNYDIGHTVSTGGGGLASLGSICTSGKAQGITGSPAPVGDPYDIDYVAHEMGHQFGGNHSFNGNGGSCTGNRNGGTNGTAVEPGSGSTIMAYAGICEDNVQNNSDAYFHAVNIAEMTEYVAAGCVLGLENFNAAPVVQNLSNYTIPKGTPFVLTGSATDDSSSALTYCWEQTNTGFSTANPSPTTTTSNPNFRSFTPSLSPKRYFPEIDKILSGSLISTWEVIPNVARTMNFALTVRDNAVPTGGQTQRKNMTVTFNSTAGPFKVTSQSTSGITWTNTPQTITWNVASTNVAPINTTNVNILLSTDGGLTYPITLVANTPNDGSQVITVPNIVSSNCRIMIEAVGNIFLAVNSNQFSIDNNLSTSDFELNDLTIVPNPNSGNFNVKFNSTSDNDVLINVYDISGRQIFAKSYPNQSVFAQNIQLDNVQAGVYLVNIQDGKQKSVRKIIVQ